ncbi:MAG: hypothetical protein JXA41_11360 [Deltaproteobacteria bacterium]|nr:hypothetical protein [Deltaproteobacteria bacterium]
MESFLTAHLTSKITQKQLGVKVAKIDIREENGVYHIVSPYFEQHIAPTIGPDHAPMRLVNSRYTSSSDTMVSNTLEWKYKDFGKDMEYRHTSGYISDKRK